MGDPQESSRERKHEHVEAVESILDSVDPALEEHAYPVDSEDLSAQYGETVIELPNETESLGSVFDRLDDDEYDSPMAAKEAVLREVSGATPEPTVAGADGEREPGGQGAPAAVREDLESDEVAAAAREGGAGDDVDIDSPAEEATDVGTPAGAASEPAAEGAEPGDELTPDTTEGDEFDPTESVEDRDREGDDRAAAERERPEGDPGVESEVDDGSTAETGDAAGRDASGEPDDGTVTGAADSAADDVDVDYQDVVDESAAEDQPGDDDVAEAGRDSEERGRR